MIGFTAGSGAWYYYRAELAQKGCGGKIGLAILGGALFLVFFVVANGIIGSNMPRWFYRFIMDHGDPAGSCLVMVAIAFLNFIIPVVFVRSAVS